MRIISLRAGAVFLLALTTAAVFCGGAGAHPLGNFSINRYSRLTAGPRDIRLDYVLDMAEIPTFQEMDRIDADGDGQVNAAERDAYLSRAESALLHGIHLQIAGVALPLVPRARALEMHPGQGGLSCLRVTFTARASYPQNAATRSRVGLEYEDTNYPGRLGWKEIVLRAEGGTTVASSTVSSTDRSNMLQAYPDDLLMSPLDETHARAEIVLAPQGAASSGATNARHGEESSGTRVHREPAGVSESAPRSSSSETRTQSAASRHGDTSATNASPRSVSPDGGAHRTENAPQVGARTSSRFAVPSDRFAALIARRTLTFPVLFVSLLVALALGAFHALSPGHGKTIVAAYLVGSRGTARHALFLGLVVTLTHTAGVYALGLFTLVASHYILPERLYPWLGFVSGVIVAVIGGFLFHERIERLLGRTEEHRHLFFRHSHEPGDAHSHSHAPDGAVTARSLLALGVGGGLVPCPSAIVVLLSAIALHRVGFGLLLILAFSVGLASVLMALGVLFVYGARYLQRFGDGGLVMKVLPVGSAAIVAILGLVIAIQSLVAGGILSFRV
jgi:ABC-type nickel/cobalt efflux system permease component RcnA